MAAKEVSFWVMEEGKPARKMLGEIIEGEEEFNYYTNPITCMELSPKFSHEFGPSLLMWESIAALKEIKKLYEIITAMNPGLNPEKLALEAEIAFAAPDAYQQLCKDRETDLDSEGHYYCQTKEVLVKMPEDASLEKICSCLKHEYGHHLDYLLDPEGFDCKTAAMREVMAVFFENLLGVNDIYSNECNVRAQDLLQQLYENKHFQEQYTANQWQFLSGFYSDELLQLAITMLTGSKSSLPEKS